MAQMLYLGDDVTLPGNIYPPFSAFQIPARSGLQSALFLGSGLTSQFGAGGPPSVVGSPTVNANNYQMNGSNYLSEATPETLAMSMLVIARKVTASDAVGFVGNTPGGSSAPTGVAIYSGASTGLVQLQSSRVGTPAGQTTQVTASTTEWGMYLASIPATGSNTLYNLTTGTSNNSPASEARELNSGTIRVGNIPHATYAGSSRIALSMIWNRALSAAEAGTVGAWARTYAAAIGITV
ncbi:hypothetical protein [Paracoccus sp. JM45]|uniref:hypothetical protein n=1 Tax=Paracoccus sp. JM45 TaxID=2283626 RepID=UPI000E6B6316|nr:hypothetical protein [Paracoccus sp. JM45]RJE81269.1 hypothetical protein DWB67_01015 [Paracoccus sp. JM45]